MFPCLFDHVLFFLVHWTRDFMVFLVRVWGLCAFSGLGFGDFLVFLGKGWGLCRFPGLGFGDLLGFLG